MVDRLSNLVAIFEARLDFRSNRAEGDDCSATLTSI